MHYKQPGLPVLQYDTYIGYLIIMAQSNTVVKAVVIKKKNGGPEGTIRAGREGNGACRTGVVAR